MKIALVFDGLQIGGIERVGSDYAKLLVSNNHEVTIFNLNPSLTDMEEAFPEECGIIHYSYSRKFAPEQYTQLVKKGYFYKCAYPIIFTLLSVFNVLLKVFTVFDRRFQKEFDVVIAFSGHFNDLTFVANNFIKNKKRLCWLHGALYSYLLISDGYLNLYRKIQNLIVLVDDAQEEVLSYHSGLEKQLNITKLYNPTFIAHKPLQQDLISSLKARYGDFIIMVSRFSYPHKDHYTVAKAMEILNDKYGLLPNLLFIGDGPEEDLVKMFVAKLPKEVSEHIHFMGAQKNVEDYYASAKLLVHASVAGEGLPTIILEGLSYQLPMVVTDSKTGPREILGDNQYGLLCAVKNPEDMADKIYELLTDSDLYDLYRLRSKERVEDFNPKTIQFQLENVLSKLILEEK
ncbi:TPA: glycosyltransferase [Streptococcus suis]|nr:glycosyltransferase [Streptococcus suis]